MELLGVGLVFFSIAAGGIWLLRHDRAAHNGKVAQHRPRIEI